MEEIKINITMRHYYIPIRRTKIKIKKKRARTVSSSGKDMAHVEHSYFAGGMQSGTTILGNTLATSCKIKQTQYDSAIPYPGEMIAYVYTQICKQIYILGLLIIIKNWKKSNPSTGKWIDKVW